jgi:hypothetical protein
MPSSLARLALAALPIIFYTLTIVLLALPLKREQWVTVYDYLNYFENDGFCQNYATYVGPHCNRVHTAIHLLFGSTVVGAASLLLSLMFFLFSVIQPEALAFRKALHARRAMIPLENKPDAVVGAWDINRAVTRNTNGTGRVFWIAFFLFCSLTTAVMLGSGLFIAMAALLPDQPWIDSYPQSQYTPAYAYYSIKDFQLLIAAWVMSLVGLATVSIAWVWGLARTLPDN